MRTNIAEAERHVIDQYRRFLRTSYRFLDPKLRDQFESRLDQADIVVRGPYVTLSREFEKGVPLEALVAGGKAQPELARLNWSFKKFPLYKHQQTAFEIGIAGRPFVVTSGTGSGKTEAFLLPILSEVIRRKKEGVTGSQAILLYPMNALANDQLERMRRLLRGTGVRLSYYLYTGDSDAAVGSLREAPAEYELKNREAARKSPPDIILTNYKQLEFMLVRKEDRVFFTRSLRYLVLDELHSYRGALATEIACLIRRVKAHASLAPGELVGIGTSATVASGDEGSKALAEFASVLVGEAYAAEDIVGEQYVKPDRSAPPYDPPLGRWKLSELRADDTDSLVAFAESLTGRTAPASGSVSERIGVILAGNSLVELLEEVFASPASVENAVDRIRTRFPDRADLPREVLLQEIEAYLVAGSAYEDGSPPRLRPKFHAFFHGIYDVNLCLDPACRQLVFQGADECNKCGSMAYPAALCRTCGQDFVKARTDDEGRLYGTADFFSDENTRFLAPKLHQLGEDEDDEEESPPKKKSKAKEKVRAIQLCVHCGQERDGACPECHTPAIPYLMAEGKLNKCPTCEDQNTRVDIVSPLRTGTASTVSAIMTHHLDPLEGQDRRLLVFADNRQDVAHQAGYTSDKHRAFALRHVIAHEVHKANGRGVSLDELPQIIFDHYQRLGFVEGRPTRLEKERWSDAITFQMANEITRFSRLRIALENLGLVAVEYEFLDEVAKDEKFREACRHAGLDEKGATNLVRAFLDIMRKSRAVAYPFFQKYLNTEERWCRELEGNPYYARFPEQDKAPKGYALDRPDHIRKAKAGVILGFVRENRTAGKAPALHSLIQAIVGDRDVAERFVRAAVDALVRYEILVRVPNFPLGKTERVPGMAILQIDPRVIRLAVCADGYRCEACRQWRPYHLPVCPKCRRDKLKPDKIDQDNYYVRLYTEQDPRQLRVGEHSAQISGEERAKRETSFKDGKLEALVCTPTMELGVDIGDLLTVVLRNAPPTPANYAQRVGRAGRRLGIGYISTFCTGGAHDRHAFENPEWLVTGRFSPPRLRLDNLHVVRRHLNSLILEQAEAQLPRLMKELLDNFEAPTRWMPEAIRDLCEEVQERRAEMIDRLEALFRRDREAGRLHGYGRKECEDLVDTFPKELERILDRWWQRVKQLDKEYQTYSKIGAPTLDQKKARARRRAYIELTSDLERGYSLNYLSTRGFLPAYQFPQDTFSLDPGVDDTPTIYRPSGIAIEEFAPGNLVYANGHKLRSIRALFAGGPGSADGRLGRADAASSGRLRSFVFCDACGEASEEILNDCPNCKGTFREGAIECAFVEDFEAEVNIKIGSEEESRQKKYYRRKEHLLRNGEDGSFVYPYLGAPLEYRRRAEVLVTNWGKSEKRGEPIRFRLCRECGRYQEFDPNLPEESDRAIKWSSEHARYCAGDPAPLILGYQFTTDVLILTVPKMIEAPADQRFQASGRLHTLAEAILLGAASLLELEASELAAFSRSGPGGKDMDEIIFYETVPGGAGYLEEMAVRWPEVAQHAMQRLYHHDCIRSCYLCLKTYRNQRFHGAFDKGTVRDLLLTFSDMERVPRKTGKRGDAENSLRQDFAQRRQELLRFGRLPGTPGPQSPIEASLQEALRGTNGLPAPTIQYEFREEGRRVTVADFAWPDVKLAVFCDGYAFHGNPDTLELDAAKRNYLQKEGWTVLTFWGRTINRNPAKCAEQIWGTHVALRARRRE
ncbi:MAG: DEAD/DEAH box helicase [Planctomycetes bacterium]|nr:DEAD/DEAH box helicase [Planctomycetota bacterium]